jgi:hypothetical protein
MEYRPRSISFLDREGRVKHYGIGTHAPEPRAPLVAALKDRARECIPEGAPGFTIAHDATSAGLGIVYWWANENEIHRRLFASPIDDPGALEPFENGGLACVWELEVIDFERRAYLEEVLKRGDVDAYLGRSLDPIVL